MSALLALISAGLYGAADFLGGLATRRSPALVVVAVAQTTGLVLLLLLAAAVRPAAPSGLDVLWASAAGLAGGVGVALLYKGLALGTMGVVAPVTAICAVVIPVGAGMIAGERPSTLAATGIVIALLAIALVSQQPDEQKTHRASSRSVLPPGVPVALASGVAIGLFFLFLAKTGGEGALWPLVASRATSAVLFSAVVLATHGVIALPRRQWLLSLGAGVLDVGANASYLLASREGPLSTAVTLASLYPASTIVLAAIVLRERFSMVQTAGIVAALLAVALIVSG